MGGEDMLALYEVQQADSELARLSKELEELDAGEALAAEIAALEAETKSLAQQERRTEQEAEDRTLELRGLEEKREKFRAQLYGGTVRNPRQLSDLEGEVAMLSREISKLEDQILGLMEALEEQRGTLSERERRLAEMRERLAGVQERHQAQSARLRGEIAELEGQRAAAAARVERQLLKRYEQIRARQGNLGLVRVTATTCPGCRIALPSDTIKALHRGTRGLTCDNCGRLLFWDGEPTAPR